MILPRQQGKLMMAITWNCVLVTYLLGLYLIIQSYQAAICGDLFSFIELEITLLNGALIAGIDGISIWLIWLTLAIIPLCILSSCWTYETIADETRMKFFLIFYLVLEALIIAVFTCCWDFFLFYFVFEFVLIPIYLIIGIWGSKKNRILSSYQLFLYTILGSFFMLIAMWMIFYDSGTFCYFFLSCGTFSHLREIVVWFALVAAFATKIPMFPLHIWLPEAHVEAPTTGSVILAALLLKLGTYGLIRWLLPIMPVASHQLIPFILTFALLAIVFTSVTASRQVDLKKILAYASCGHMNLLIIGLFSSNLTAIAGALIMHLSHGFVAAGLFIFIGHLADRFYTRNIKYLRGLSGPLPLIGTLFLTGSLNFVAEILIFIGSFTKQSWVSSCAATGVFLGATYSLWLATRIIFGSLSLYIQGWNEMNWRECFTQATLLLPIAVFGFYPMPMCFCILPSLHFWFMNLAIVLAGAILCRRVISVSLNYRISSTNIIISHVAVHGKYQVKNQWSYQWYPYPLSKYFKSAIGIEPFYACL